MAVNVLISLARLDDTPLTGEEEAYFFTGMLPSQEYEAKALAGHYGPGAQQRAQGWQDMISQTKSPASQPKLEQKQAD